MIIHENDFLEPYGINIHGVIEVGAHYAEEYPGMVHGGIENFMFFEPIKANYDKMVSLLPSLPTIKTYNIALGNYTGRTTMFVETSHQGKSCSVLKPHLHLEEYPDIVFDDQEWVDIARLDDFGFDRSLYNMLQTDAQGYDLEVLKGARSTIATMDFIKVEVNSQELYEGACTEKQVDDYLIPLGFEKSYTYWMGLWGDAYYVRI
jgi:FkbM family methyltransferase